MQVIALLLLVSFQSFAALPELFFENVSGEYTYEYGKAYAPSAQYKIDNVSLTHKDIEVNFNRNEKNLVLKGPNTVVHFGFDFSFLNIFKRIDFSGVDITLNKDGFKSSASNLMFQIADLDYTAFNVDINTTILDINARDRSMQLVESLISEGSVTVDKIIYKSSGSAKMRRDLIDDGVPLSAVGFNAKKSNMLQNSVLRWMKITVDKGGIKGSVLIDSWINAWLRFYGKIRNFRSDRVVEIELTKAKLGYFSVKKLVLNALKKLDSDKIKVRGNLIRIDLALSSKKAKP